MCLGTGSHAGKSVFAAALCRIYARRGYRVAPFKAQNMALNSFVTREGGEIGRSQAYQSRAAGVEPHVDMNPVLLKPSSETGSQVVVLGRPVGHMSAQEYRAFQPRVWPTVTAALERLRAAHDLIVIEGAGSPAEVNLRDQDIVNMRVAQYAQCPVLLIGDIDRGGVFAALVGHMELFTPEERALVKGFVINKFRGDASLLDSGVEFLRERTGVATIGVIPMLSDWRGEEEDSLGIEDRQHQAKPRVPLQIAVARLPFMSNSTDFDALADEPDVNVRYVSSPAELSGAATIVLPGTKSTIADLAWLRESGLAAAVCAAAVAGRPVIGICGGYQMLGRRILDPQHIETTEPEVPGLGLLDVETTFSADKLTARVNGELLAHDTLLGLAGTPLHGYEIHMGRTTRGSTVEPLLRLRGADGEEHAEGAVSTTGKAPGGTVCGSYVHGLFDHPALRGAFLGQLRSGLGLPARVGMAAPADDGIERLADHVEAHLDCGLLEPIVGLETR